MKYLTNFSGTLNSQYIKILKSNEVLKHSCSNFPFMNSLNEIIFW